MTILYKAQPIGDDETLDIAISATESLSAPKFELDWEEKSRALFRSQARAIAEQLQRLPGGTWDALLVLMLESKLSLFRVPICSIVESPKPGEPTPEPYVYEQGDELFEGNGVLPSVPISWILKRRFLPAQERGKTIRAVIHVGYQDGRILADNHPVEASPLIVRSYAIGGGTPGGPPVLVFRRP